MNTFEIPLVDISKAIEDTVKPDVDNMVQNSMESLLFMSNAYGSILHELFFETNPAIDGSYIEVWTRDKAFNTLKGEPLKSLYIYTLELNDDMSLKGFSIPIKHLSLTDADNKRLESAIKDMFQVDVKDEATGRYIFTKGMPEATRYLFFITRFVLRCNIDS